ncbi:MAG: hypothetical protein ACFFAS_11075 [Promethearchaeota archaeon]
MSLDDPIIVFVFPEDRGSYGCRLVSNLYEKINRNVRFAPKTDLSIIQYGRKACSGRECLPGISIAGAIMKDIYENRSKDEITIYKAPIDQHGPCQNGGWPIMWKAITDRLKIKNTMLYISPSRQNNYLGLPFELLTKENIYFVVGKYLKEARNALYCIAEDRDSAMILFEQITDDFINSMKEENHGLRMGLLKWAKEIRKIPRKTTIEKVPKVLIIGGLNLLFIHRPIEEFFLSKGIVPKTVDFTESLLLFISEPSIRFGYKKGMLNPEQQFTGSSYENLEVSEEELKEFQKAKRTVVTIQLIEAQLSSLRKAMRSANLLFDTNTEFKDILALGHQFLTLNCVTETTAIVGRYLDALKKNIYDAVINLGTFNCQPAMNSQAILRPIVNKSDVPYAAVDCEGPWITSNQLRLLETIAIQAMRLRNEKNNRSLLEEVV